jgi:hypothetical protein
MLVEDDCDFVADVQKQISVLQKELIWKLLL